MMALHTRILSALDKCCKSFTFPMLDNGYVYLAASRLSLYRYPSSSSSSSFSSSNTSPDVEWAMVIEIFGFSPRNGVPDTHIYTFSNNLIRQPLSFPSSHLYNNYLANNSHNESVFIHPITGDDGKHLGDWQDGMEGAVAGASLRVRDKIVKVPEEKEVYEKEEVTMSSWPHIKVFEVCRWLAATERERVLATEEERRKCVPERAEKIMQLEDWHHPNVVNSEDVVSENRTFQMLAEVLESGEVERYDPASCEPPNTHWKNWPEGGSL